ncbi:MAG TPA: hypothetical protein PKV27_01585 [Ilumatobacteraceae bacterium]|nr:hypothetical protein [Ilumatobacteraceae bacterium]
MNIPHQRRYPMRPIGKPIDKRPAYNFTLNTAKTTPAQVAAVIMAAVNDRKKRRWV